MKREHLTILLVDDDPNDLLFIERAFRRLGITDPIRTCSSGSEAIAYLNGEGEFADRSKYEFPSFILSDLKMPNGDGFALLQAVRSHPKWAIIPFAIISGSGDEDDIKKAYQAGANSYFIKPSLPAALMDLLRTFHAYWTTVEAPRIDQAGDMLPTYSINKIGERFS
jgi:CheY-like chemotaxis protein